MDNSKRTFEKYKVIHRETKLIGFQFFRVGAENLTNTLSPTIQVLILLNLANGLRMRGGVAPYPGEIFAHTWSLECSASLKKSVLQLMPQAMHNLKAS
jgi:hypothetical protein